MATIIDVAKKAGVSKSTVSRVLTNNGYVSEESKQKVLDAMDEIGYIPNLLARQLQSGVTKTIGFIAPSYMIYTQNYDELLKTHIESGADITLLYHSVDNAKEYYQIVENSYQFFNMLELQQQHKYMHISA